MRLRVPALFLATLASAAVSLTTEVLAIRFPVFVDPIMPSGHGLYTLSFDSVAGKLYQARVHVSSTFLVPLALICLRRLPMIWPIVLCRVPWPMSN